MFEEEYTESHQTLDYVLINSGQKQLTTADCIEDVKLKHDFVGKVEEIGLNGSGWRCSRLKFMHIKVSMLTDIGGTILLTLNHKVELFFNYNSIINLINFADIYFAL